MRTLYFYGFFYYSHFTMYVSVTYQEFHTYFKFKKNTLKLKIKNVSSF